MPPSPAALKRRFPIEADCMVWLSVLSQIDLAVRHPENNGAAARVAEQFSDQLRDRLYLEGVLSQEEYTTSLREQIKYRKNPIPGTGRAL
jgi:hypothetical protein